MHSLAGYGSWLNPKSRVSSRLDHVNSTNKLYQCLFGTVPRPPLQQGLDPVGPLQLLCSNDAQTEVIPAGTLVHLWIGRVGS